MPTNEEPIVVGNDVTPEMMARIKGMQGEEKPEGIVYEQPDQAQEDLDVDINLANTEGEGSADAGQGGEPQLDSQGVQQGDGEASSGDQSAENFDRSPFEEFLKAQGKTEDEYLDKLFYNKTFKVRMGGKDKELPYSEIKSVLARGTTFQKKFNEIENSDEYRFGVLMKAAEGGNAEAQAALKQKLIEFTGAEDGDGMLDKLDEVDGEYDLDGEMKKHKNESGEDEHFADVKEDVDYQKNLDIIQTDMKDFMPPKIWKAFWDAPEDRRAMYNLAATGKMKEIGEYFQSQLQSLPLERQVEIESDPDLYGRTFINVTNRLLNGQKAKQEQGNSEDPNTQGIQQVSDGSRGRSAKAGASSVPDFAKMSSQEFRAWQEKNGLIQ